MTSPNKSSCTEPGETVLLSVGCTQCRVGEPLRSARVLCAFSLLSIAFLTAGCGPCVVGSELLDGLPYLFVLGLGAVLCVFGYYVIRDGFRFGCTGMPWAVAVIGSAIFSGAGFFFVGKVGTAAGAPFLVAFSLGRHRRRRETKESRHTDAA